MAYELIFNLVLIVLFTICLITAQSLPDPSAMDLLTARHWSSTILVLLIFFLVINVCNIVRSTPKEERNLSALTKFRISSLFKSKLFYGMATMLAYALLLDKTGFLLTSFVASLIFDYLLGERNYVRMVIFSFFAVLVLYILFFSGMGIMLPRGVGFLRTFALSFESILRNIF